MAAVRYIIALVLCVKSQNIKFKNFVQNPSFPIFARKARLLNSQSLDRNSTELLRSTIGNSFYCFNTGRMHDSSIYKKSPITFNFQSINIHWSDFRTCRISIFRKIKRIDYWVYRWSSHDLSEPIDGSQALIYGGYFCGTLITAGTAGAVEGPIPSAYHSPATVRVASVRAAIANHLGKLGLQRRAGLLRPL